MAKAQEQQQTAAEKAPPPRPAGRRRRVPVIRLALVGLVLALAVGAAGLVLTGRVIHLPVWAVAEIESRLNRLIGQSHLPAGAALSLGAVEISVERDLVPRLVLRDIRLVETSGASLLALPEVRLSLDPAALLSGQVRPRTLRLTGARVMVARDAEGRLSLQFGALSGNAGPQSPAEIFDALDRMFSTETLAGLRLIQADALAVTLTDARAGRTWEVGDGRLVVENRKDALAAELGLTLLDGEGTAQARLGVETAKADSSARLWVAVSQVSAADLASQVPPLAFLEIVSAPISGRLTGALDATGSIARMEGELSLDAGTLQLAENAAPVTFERAGLRLHFDPAAMRVTLDTLAVESASLHLGASGTLDLQDGAGGPAAAGALPDVVLGQFDFSEVTIDPEGLFETPVHFGDGSLDLRLHLHPLQAEIGQLSLREGQQRLHLVGRIGAEAGGLGAALDVKLNSIDTDRLIKLWPLSVEPKTRVWVAENVGEGQLHNVTAALRLAPKEAPRFALGYEFSGAEVRFIKTLPPVRNGHGRSGIEGNTYTVVVEGGHVIAPAGGKIDVTGTVFRIPDIRPIGPMAEVRLLTDADLPATLSILDQDPFFFISRAGRSVDLGEGRAVLVSDLRFPLVDRILTEDVDFDVSGRILDFHSDKLVPGQIVTSPDLAVKVTAAGLTLSGEGHVAEVPMVARYEQPFGDEFDGAARVRGTAELTDARLRSLGVALPEGWFGGTTTAEVELELPRDRPAKLLLKGDLKGATLRIAALSWSKGAKAAADLTVEATLSSPPQVDRIALEAPGLVAEGRLSTRAGGDLDKAEFPRLKVGDWLDASAEITGRGGNRAADVALTGGTLDLRFRPTGDGDGGRSAITVALDRLVVSSGVALTGFTGAFDITAAGLDGSFRAGVNGQSSLSGTTVPTRAGTAVRIRSEDAGGIMAAAGIFTKGRGGTLDLTMQPRGAEGRYVGIAAFKRLSVQGAPALAELLSAVSVIGLLEQMDGQGIMFSDGDAEFRLRPEGVEITRGAAIGASMGLSFAGLYRAGSGEMDIQGTISPIYILNGIGQLVSRKGEGLFGFNYRLTGTADDPRVSVNPLSILTPGMFREIFRRPVPVLGEGEGG